MTSQVEMFSRFNLNSASTLGLIVSLKPCLNLCSFRWSLLICVPYVLMCQRGLCGYLLTCQRVLRAYVLTCQSALRALRAHVLSCYNWNNKNKFSVTYFPDNFGTFSLSFFWEINLFQILAFLLPDGSP